MDLVTQFEQLDEAAIRRFVTEQQEENLHLDFKLVRDPTLNRDDRKTLAVALSGFANADGGLVVWGVDARPNEQGIDCAMDCAEIKPLQLFISNLNKFTSDAANPMVDGVLHRALHTDAGRGFAVTLVPPSDAGPHMAKLGEDRYYKRSGDSFRKMEHFDIEDMFGRRKRPALSISSKIYGSGRSGGPHGTVCTFRISIGIQNSGRGSAMAPYLAVRVSRPFEIDWYGIDGSRNEGLARLSSMDNTFLRYGGMGEVVIHPGTVREVFAIKGTFNGEFSDLKNLEMEYEVAAEGFRLVKGIFRIFADEIWDSVQGR